MDLLTHTALAICIAQFFFRKTLGERAIYLAVLCSVIPDVDIFVYATSSFHGLKNNMGPTHSLFYLSILAPILSAAFLFFAKKGSYTTWTALCFSILISHPLLDWCTPYGVQLLYPFSNDRFATGGIAFIDLCYTLPLLVGAVWSIKKETTKVAFWALCISHCYLGFSHFLSVVAKTKLQAHFEQHKL